jgi:hypothetical protein
MSGFDRTKLQVAYLVLVAWQCIAKSPNSGGGECSTNQAQPGSRHNQKQQTASAPNRNCLNLGGHPKRFLVDFGCILLPFAITSSQNIVKD